LVYSWSWADIHFVCLDLCPDPDNLRWLARDLAKVGRARPVIIFFHYSIEGPYSDFWEEEQKDAFARAIEGRNVPAIFHGHYHRAGRYQWRGHDVFLPGSPRHSSHAFLVVRIGANSLAVAFRDFDKQAWSDVFVKPIRR
jgi:cytolysin (calcineurin-like family phosphatase)